MSSSSMSITIGLNNSEGKNRIRFESLSERLQKIHVDVLHDYNSMSSRKFSLMNSLKDTMDSYFLAELEEIIKIETSPVFRRSNKLIFFKPKYIIHFLFCFIFRLYNRVFPLSQSLPELIHNQDEIIAYLIEFIDSSPILDLLPYLKLVAVLARFILLSYNLSLF